MLSLEEIKPSTPGFSHIFRGWGEHVGRGPVLGEESSTSETASLVPVIFT